MSYYLSKRLDLPFAEAVDKAIAALKTRGVGVLTRIDVQSTLKEKIGADFRPYVIPGACNPKMAHQTLIAEDKIGTKPPYNGLFRHSTAAARKWQRWIRSRQCRRYRTRRWAAIAQKVRGELKAAFEAIQVFLQTYPRWRAPVENHPPDVAAATPDRTFDQSGTITVSTRHCASPHVA